MVKNNIKIGNVDKTIHYGNMIRKQRGFKPISLEDVFLMQDFWELVIARSINIHESSAYNMLEEYKDDSGQIDYLSLVKEFPTLITQDTHCFEDFPSMLDSNSGYLMDSYLLTKIAVILDKDLELQIYDSFIKTIL